MLDQLAGARKRYEEIAKRLCDPSVLSQVDEVKKLMQESKTLEPIITLCSRLEQAQNQKQEALELLRDAGNDTGLRELLNQELKTADDTLTELEHELQALMQPKDPLDERNVIMEIRSGAGGEESALFAGSLFRMYSMYAETKGWTLEVVSANETELGGYHSVNFIVSGQGAYSRLKFESGGHRVQRVPETESGGRIHTSAATVAVLPEIDEVDVQLNPADLHIDTYRSSGAGGQKVNKTSSAIRITHIPTGLVVECQDERSQYKNKDKAMRVLYSRLYEIEHKKQQDSIAADRKAQVGSGDRSDRIRTYNFPQGRVTDHRIGLTLYKIDRIMDGDLDEIIDALTAAEQADKMAEAES